MSKVAIYVYFVNLILIFVDSNIFIYAVAGPIP